MTNLRWRSSGSLASPVPHCPWSLLPQQAIVPSRSSAQVCASPALTPIAYLEGLEPAPDYRDLPPCRRRARERHFRPSTRPPRLRSETGVVMVGRQRRLRTDAGKAVAADAPTSGHRAWRSPAGTIHWPRLHTGVCTFAGGSWASFRLGLTALIAVEPRFAVDAGRSAGRGDDAGELVAGDEQAEESR